MQISRRDFFASAFAGIASRGSIDPLEGLSGALPRFPHCFLLASGSDRLHVESLTGYRGALLEGGIPFKSGRLRQCPSRGLIVAPSLGRADGVTVRHLAKRAEYGASVLFECGVFADRTEFETERRACHLYFGISLEPPANLWHEDSKSAVGVPGRVPYVDLNWPLASKVRDFSRIVPLGETDGEAIGWRGGVPIALKKRLGEGVLIFLGSPIGPALAAGDTEAHEWFEATVEVIDGLEPRHRRSSEAVIESPPNHHPERSEGSSHLFL